MSNLQQTDHSQDAGEVIDRFEYYDPRSATSEEVELMEWAANARRKSMPVVNDALKQMLTISTALLAGSVAFFTSQPVMPGWAKTGGCISLVLCLLTALIGNLPTCSSLVSNKEIRQARSWLFWRSTICLWVANAAFSVGMVFFVAGFLCK